MSTTTTDSYGFKPLWSQDKLHTFRCRIDDRIVTVWGADRYEALRVLAENEYLPGDFETIYVCCPKAEAEWMFIA